MSTHYSVNRVTLSNNERINTNFNDFMNENKDWLKEEVTKNTTKTNRCVFDGSSYGWFYLDDNENIIGVCRYGGNYIKPIIHTVYKYLENQIDEETISMYKKDDMDILQYLVVVEYETILYELRDKGKEIWNKIHSNYDYYQMLEDDFEDFILNDFYNDLKEIDFETLKQTSLNTLLKKYKKLYDSDWIEKKKQSFMGLRDEFICSKTETV